MTVSSGLIIHFHDVDPKKSTQEAQSLTELAQQLQPLFQNVGIHAGHIELTTWPHEAMEINEFLDAFMSCLRKLLSIWREKSDESRTCRALAAAGHLLHQGLGVLQGAITARLTGDALCDAPTAEQSNASAFPQARLTKAIAERLPIELLRIVASAHFGPQVLELDRDEIIEKLFPPKSGDVVN